MLGSASYWRAIYRNKTPGDDRPKVCLNYTLPDATEMDLQEGPNNPSTRYKHLIIRLENWAEADTEASCLAQMTARFAQQYVSLHLR